MSEWANLLTRTHLYSLFPRLQTGGLGSRHMQTGASTLSRPSLVTACMGWAPLSPAVSGTPSLTTSGLISVSALPSDPDSKVTGAGFKVDFSSVLPSPIVWRENLYHALVVAYNVARNYSSYVLQIINCSQRWPSSSACCCRASSDPSTLLPCTHSCVSSGGEVESVASGLAGGPGPEATVWRLVSLTGGSGPEVVQTSPEATVWRLVSLTGGSGPEEVIVWSE